jgi:hypothetical protein
MPFLRGRKRATEKELHKELKQVRKSKVVVGDAAWDHRGPVAGLRARKDPFVPPNSLRNCLHGPKKIGKNMVSFVKTTCYT